MLIVCAFRTTFDTVYMIAQRESSRSPLFWIFNLYILAQDNSQNTRNPTDVVNNFGKMFRVIRTNGGLCPRAGRMRRESVGFINFLIVFLSMLMLNKVLSPKRERKNSQNGGQRRTSGRCAAGWRTRERMEKRDVGRDEVDRRGEFRAYARAHAMNMSLLARHARLSRVSSGWGKLETYVPTPRYPLSSLFVQKPNDLLSTSPLTRIRRKPDYDNRSIDISSPVNTPRLFSFSCLTKIDVKPELFVISRVHCINPPLSPSTPALYLFPFVDSALSPLNSPRNFNPASRYFALAIVDLSPFTNGKPSQTPAYGPPSPFYSLRPFRRHKLTTKPTHTCKFSTNEPVTIFPEPHPKYNSPSPLYICAF